MQPHPAKTLALPNTERKRESASLRSVALLLVAHRENQSKGQQQCSSEI